MLKIALVEDEEKYRKQIRSYMDKYRQEYMEEIELYAFETGNSILESYKKEYDIIILDIQLPDIDGMTVAQEIRKRDSNVILMFITNMAQYAIKGYSVGALDFVTKPINYYIFCSKITRAIQRAKRAEEKNIWLDASQGKIRLKLSQIYYIEGQNRMLYYHTTEGIYKVSGTMVSADKDLRDYGFVKCNHWYLVNLRHIMWVQGNYVKVGDGELEISRRHRAPFMHALTEYIGGNV